MVPLRIDAPPPGFSYWDRTLEGTGTDTISFVRKAISLDVLAVAEQARGLTVAPNHGRFHAVDMDEPYVFSRADALTLLDATMAGGLSSLGLEDVAFLLIASDTFEFQDGDELTLEVVHDWASPEINLSLTSDNLHWFRQVLLEEIPYPPRPPLDRNTQLGAPIKVTERQPPLVDGEQRDA